MFIEQQGAENSGATTPSTSTAFDVQPHDIGTTAKSRVNVLRSIGGYRAVDLTSKALKLYRLVRDIKKVFRHLEY